MTKTLWTITRTSIISSNPGWLIISKKISLMMMQGRRRRVMKNLLKDWQLTILSLSSAWWTKRKRIKTSKLCNWLGKLTWLLGKILLRLVNSVKSKILKMRKASLNSLKSSKLKTNQHQRQSESKKSKTIKIKTEKLIPLRASKILALVMQEVSTMKWLSSKTRVWMVEAFESCHPVNAK